MTVSILLLSSVGCNFVPGSKRHNEGNVVDDDEVDDEYYYRNDSGNDDDSDG